MAPAGGDQAQVFALGTEAGKGRSAQAPLEVAGERRPLANREDAGLGTRMPFDRGDIPGGEDIGMGQGLQGVAHPDEAALVHLQTGFPGPVRRSRGRDPEQLVEGGAGSVCEMQAMAVHAHHAVTGVNHDAVVLEDPREQRAHAPGVCGKDLGGIGEEFDAHVVLGPPGGFGGAREAIADRERDLHASGAAAHNPDRDRARGSGDTLPELCPAREEAVDGLDRDDRVLGTGNSPNAGRRTRIQREDVEGHRRTPGAQHPLVFEIDPHHLIAQKAGSSEARQRGQIDVGVREGVVAGDQPRKHPGVGSVRFPRDEGETDPGKRLHAEVLEYGDMGVPAADQHEILGHRSRRRPHGTHAHGLKMPLRRGVVQG